MTDRLRSEHPARTVEAAQIGPGNPWRVLIQWSPGEPVQGYSPEQAVRLAEHADAAGNTDLATILRIQAEIAAGYNRLATQ